MLYTGIDMIEIDRIERAVARWGERFLQRVFTPTERAACANRLPSLAARWAAKEATAKLLGVGLRGLGGSAKRPTTAAVGWHDIEVTNDPYGRPVLVFSGGAAAHVAALGLRDVAVSLSHTRLHAIASVVALAH